MNSDFGILLIQKSRTSTSASYCIYKYSVYNVCRGAEANDNVQVYSMMERVVAGPSFLQKLTMASTRSQKVSTTQVLGKETRNKPDVTQPEFWEDVTAPHEDSQNNTVDHLQDADYEKVAFTIVAVC